MTAAKHSLAATQAILAGVLRRATPIATDDDAADSADALATGNDRLSAVEQVEIYREQYFLRHVDALRDDFSSVAHALGDKNAFDALAREYLAAHPPSTFTLRDLGCELPPFLATHRPFCDDPLLADLARVEWAFIEAFDGPDAPALDLACVASIPEDEWPNARLALHPSLQRLALGFPAHDYRFAVRKGESPARPPAAAAHVAIYRGPGALHVVDLEPVAFALLGELARGAPLGAACENAGASAIQLAPWFQQWTALGWIVSVALR